MRSTMVGLVAIITALFIPIVGKAEKPTVTDYVSSSGSDRYINIGNANGRPIYVTVIVYDCVNILATCGKIANDEAIYPGQEGHFLIDINDPHQAFNFRYKYTAHF